MDISEEVLLFDGDTAHEHYQVVDMVYEGRPARILFSGHRSAAQSGLPRDDNPLPLFDYNKRFMELVTGICPRRMLLIGGGAFTLPMAILHVLPNTRIDVVELDPGLQKIAQAFFNLEPNNQLHIIHQDGRKFLDDNTEPYDVILVDAFTHDVIPHALSTAQAVTQLSRNIHRDGLVAVNVISTYRGHRAQVLRSQYATHKAVFDAVQIFPADDAFSHWQSQNFILVAQKTADDLMNHLRYPSLQPFIDINPADVTLD